LLNRAGDSGTSAGEGSIEFADSGLRLLRRFSFSGEKISDFKGIGCRWLSTFGFSYDLERNDTRLPMGDRSGTVVCEGERA
jgi:hypothetical protein